MQPRHANNKCLNAWQVLQMRNDNRIAEQRDGVPEFSSRMLPLRLSPGYEGLAKQSDPSAWSVEMP